MHLTPSNFYSFFTQTIFRLYPLDILQKNYKEKVQKFTHGKIDKPEKSRSAHSKISRIVIRLYFCSEISIVVRNLKNEGMDKEREWGREIMLNVKGI